MPFNFSKAAISDSVKARGTDLALESLRARLEFFFEDFAVDDLPPVLPDLVARVDFRRGGGAVSIARASTANTVRINVASSLKND